jgi:hypothetical protein
MSGLNADSRPGSGLSVVLLRAKWRHLKSGGAAGQLAQSLHQESRVDALIHFDDATSFSRDGRSSPYRLVFAADVVAEGAKAIYIYIDL